MLTRRSARILLCAPLFLLLVSCRPPSSDQPTPTIHVEPTEEDTPVPDPTDTPVSVPTFTPTANPFGDEVSYVPRQSYNGLRLSQGGDADAEFVEGTGSDVTLLRSGNGVALSALDGNNDPDYYLRFQVDDDFLYAGSPSSRIVFVIEYLDDGFDTFNIQYDALSGGPYENGQFKDTPMVRKTGTGEFITVEIPICDANFANRDQDADFRIGDSSDGAETFRSITIRRVADQSG